MQIDVLKLIEEALIGGRNGEIAYIYNNPFIAQIYREWRNGKKFNSTFGDFLLEILNTEQVGCANQTVTTYKPISKKYQVSEYDEKYKEYKKIQSQINDLEIDKQDILREIAESKNKTLADISTYEIVYGEYNYYIEFKVNVNEIIKIDTGIKE